MASNRIDTELQGITDLTVLARIKPGFVPGFESISHADRLQRVLKTLNALRQAARESPTPLPTGFEPFTDVVSRFRIVHSFRFAILPAEPGGAQKLLLNVNFDGGWEPYMRVIWRDLGAMLDLIFCHCEDYPLAREHDFPTYQAWVRANEVTSDFLFIESGRSVADQQYLEQLEALQRQQASPGAVDVAAAQLALPADHQARILPAIGLKPLNALFALARYFPLGSPHGHCLLRAAQDILFELRALDTRQLFPAGHPLRQRYFQALAWFESDPAIPAPKPERLKFEPQQIQAGLLTPYPEVSHGCLAAQHRGPASGRRHPSAGGAELRRPARAGPARCTAGALSSGLPRRHGRACRRAGRSAPQPSRSLDPAALELAATAECRWPAGAAREPEQRAPAGATAHPGGSRRGQP